MPLLHELGTAVRQRRLEIGLSQQQLADLAGLSRATVNELETGRLKDLSARRLERLANELGFAVGLVGLRPARDKGALDAAARIAGVSYATELPSHVLIASLMDGSVPAGFIPHMRTLLEEAPVAILAGIADDLRRAHDVPSADTWKRMRMLAEVLKCRRPLWQSLST